MNVLKIKFGKCSAIISSSISFSVSLCVSLPSSSFCSSDWTISLYLSLSLQALPSACSDTLLNLSSEFFVCFFNSTILKIISFYWNIILIALVLSMQFRTGFWTYLNYDLNFLPSKSNVWASSVTVFICFFSRCVWAMLSCLFACLINFGHLIFGNPGNQSLLSPSGFVIVVAFCLLTFLELIL